MIMKKKCPNCAIVFECNSEQITECQCYSIALTNEEQQQIREKYEDCLCAKCIHTTKEYKPKK